MDPNRDPDGDPEPDLEAPGAGEPSDGTGGRRAGRDPEVALPLAIASVVLGVVGLTVPVLAWVAVVLAVVGYLLDSGYAPTRLCAIIGGAFALVGIVSAIVSAGA